MTHDSQRPSPDCKVRTSYVIGTAKLHLVYRRIIWCQGQEKGLQEVLQEVPQEVPQEVSMGLLTLIF